MRLLIATLICAAIAGCSSPPGGVTNKVLTDFGIRQQDENYVSGTDQVYQRLPEVAKPELDRLNAQERRGQIVFKQDGLKGVYQKKVKRYENFYPMDAVPIATNSQGMGPRGYYGSIEYSYRYYLTPPQATSTEAEAETASIPTDEQGRETFRYSFTPGGTWDGAKGERTKKQ